jgi:hypothetical protein
MSYGGLRYHQCRFKASHNSYERDEDLHQQLHWSGSEPWQGGCRGLELDIWRHSDVSAGRNVGYFTVAHSTPGNRPLADYLGHLLSYHAQHHGHDPVLVTLDIKSTQGSAAKFASEIDRYLGEWFDPGLVYRPADLRTRSRLPELLQVVQRAGWPRIDELKGKFVFCLSGTEAWKGHYAAHTGAGSLCFADYDVADDQGFDELAAQLPANRVFLNMHVFSADYGVWKVSTRLMSQRGYIVRAYVLDSKAIWTKALGAAVHVQSTDEVRGKTWAQAGSEPFVPV